VDHKAAFFLGDNPIAEPLDVSGWDSNTNPQSGHFVARLGMSHAHSGQVRLLGGAGRRVRA
jgi:hypothetical protein